MSVTQYNNVTINVEASISYDGRCTSHTILFEDGRHKTIGIILPCDDTVDSYKFSTNTSEQIEIISGDCDVMVEGEEDFAYYGSGNSFFVQGDSSFQIKTHTIVQYICHLEG